MTVDQLGRAYQAYRRTSGSRSIVALLAANAIPLAGVLFFDWSLLTVLVIYWLENGIVGFWNMPRILLAQGAPAPPLTPQRGRAAEVAIADAGGASVLRAAWQKARDAELAFSAKVSGDVGSTPDFIRAFGSAPIPAAGRAAIGVFFLVHYGMFWFVHGIFVFALPSFAGGPGTSLLAGCGDPDPFGSLQGCSGPFGPLIWSNVAIAGIALFLSHGASFVLNYVGHAEYRTASPTGQMSAPYGRVVVLHVTIILGAFAIATIGAPVGALLILVGLKTAFDLGLHLREHGSPGPTAG